MSLGKASEETARAVNSMAAAEHETARALNAMAAAQQQTAIWQQQTSSALLEINRTLLSQQGSGHGSVL